MAQKIYVDPAGLNTYHTALLTKLNQMVESGTTDSSNLAQLRKDIDAIQALIDAGDVDKVINKFEEIVAFLDGISEGSTISDLFNMAAGKYAICNTATGTATKVIPDIPGLSNQYSINIPYSGDDGVRPSSSNSVTINLFGTSIVTYDGSGEYMPTTNLKSTLEGIPGISSAAVSNNDDTAGCKFTIVTNKPITNADTISVQDSANDLQLSAYATRSDSYDIPVGTIITVSFVNGNTANNPTLKIGNGTAKAIKFADNRAINGENNVFALYKDITLVYNGSEWITIGKSSLGSGLWYYYGSLDFRYGEGNGISMNKNTHEISVAIESNKGLGFNASNQLTGVAFTGASKPSGTFNAGKQGMVPAPSTDGDQNKFLKGDGTWGTPTGTYNLPLAANGTRGGIQIGYTDSDNTNSSNYGVKLNQEKAYVEIPKFNPAASKNTGLVPTPASGDNNKFLKGDGTWATPDKGVTSVTITQGNGITVTNSGTSITTTGTRTISAKTASTAEVGSIKVIGIGENAQGEGPIAYIKLMGDSSSPNKDRIYVKVGTGLTVGSDGTIINAQKASTTAIGSVRLYGSNPSLNDGVVPLELDSDGKASVDVTKGMTPITSTTIDSIIAGTYSA